MLQYCHMSPDVKSSPQTTEHTHLTSLYLTDPNMIRPPTVQNTDLTISCNRNIGASGLSAGHTNFTLIKRFVTTTQVCIPLFPNQEPLLVCCYSPRPSCHYIAHQIGKYSFIKIFFLVGVRLNPRIQGLSGDCTRHKNISWVFPPCSPVTLFKNLSPRFICF
jgi:hypothetical protein